MQLSAMPGIYSRHAMNICIYCRSEMPAKVPREHVIPQSFGVFTPDLTLHCVCSVCNGYFGSKLEWPMLNQSIEGALRLQFGLKGVVGGVGAKGVTPTVAEGDDGKGARTAIRTNKDGKRETELLPQVGARRDASEPFQWCLERDLSVEFGQQFPKGSEFRIVGGRTFADVERLVQKLVAVCPTFLYGGTMKPPFNDDGGQIMLEVEYQRYMKMWSRTLKYPWISSGQGRCLQWGIEPAYKSDRGALRHQGLLLWLRPGARERDSLSQDPSRGYPEGGWRCRFCIRGVPGWMFIPDR